MRRLRRLGPLARYLAPAAALWAVPLALFLLLAGEPARLETGALSSAGPTTAPIGSREVTGVRAVSLQLGYGRPPVARAPASGVVTAVDIAAGQPITSGMPLLAIAGVPAVAQVDEVPLHRDLVVGDAGADVAALHRFLEAVGFAAPAGDTFDRRTEAAVRAFARSIGVPDDGSFRAATTVFVPSSMASAGHVLVEVGQPVSAGDPVLAGARPLLTARLVAAGGAPLDDLAGRPVVLTIGAQRLELASVELGSTDLAPLAAMLDGGRQLGLVHDQAAEAGDEAVTEELEGFTVQLPVPDRYGTVPSAAVRTDASGEECVVVVDVDGRRRAVPLPPELPPSPEVGVALVPAELTGAQVVLGGPPAGADACS